MRNINSIEHSEKYDSYYSFVDESESLEQSGIKGMRWGVRRWQNADGSLTPAGRIHYGVGTRSNKAVIDAVARDRATEYKQTKNAIIGTVLGGPGLGTAVGLLLTRSKGKGYEKLVQEYKDSPEFKNLEKTLNGEPSKIVYSDLMAQRDADLKEIDEMAKSGSSNEAKDWIESYKKQYGYDSQELKKLYEMDPYTLNDLPKSYEKVYKELGFDKNDLYVNDEGHVMRKDGKVFEYQVGNKIEKTAWLDGLAEAWGSNYKPIAGSKNDILIKEIPNKYRIGTTESDFNRSVREAQIRRVESMKKSGMTAEEIAKKLNMPIGSVNSILYS